jgi:hypothetical protein
MTPQRLTRHGKNGIFAHSQSAPQEPARGRKHSPGPYHTHGKSGWEAISILRRRNDFVSTSQAEFRAGRILLADCALAAGLAANDLLLHVTNRPARQPDEPFFVCV